MRIVGERVDRKEERRRRDVATRYRSLNLFRLNSSQQFILGFCLIFFAVQATLSHEYPAVRGVPYYSGAFMTGSAAGILSLFGGAVFYIGAKSGGAEIVTAKDVKPALILFIVVLIPTTVVIATGLALTVMYGICSLECSYDMDTSYNYGMATFLVVMQAWTLLSCIVSVIIVLLYSKHFGLHLIGGGGIGQTARVKPVVDLAHSDDYVLEKWRIKMDKLIAFQRIKDYLTATRQPKDTKASQEDS